ncbi:MAG: porin family protein [Bacteroidia bacterium]
MMKNLLLIGALTVLIHTANAQEKPLLPMCVILHGGVNLTSLDPNEYIYSPNAEIGFSGGAMYRTDGDLYLLGGLQYVSANPTISDAINMKSEKVNLQIFQVPLMAGVQILKSPDSKRCMHGQMGASFSILLDVAENSLGIEKENLWTTGFTFKGGIGADLGMFVVDFHYNLLLTHLHDYAGYDNKSRLLCWELSVGYKINIGDKEKPDSSY